MLDLVNWKKVVPGVIAALFLLVAVWSNSWWTGDMLPIAIGLRDLAQVATKRVDLFPIAAKTTFVLAHMAALSVLANSVLSQFLNLSYAPRLATGTCVATGIFTMLTVMSFPGTGSELVSLGGAFYLCMLGSVVGIFSGFASIVSNDDGWEGKKYIPVKIDRSVHGESSQELTLADAAQVEVGGASVGRRSPGVGEPLLSLSEDTPSADDELTLSFNPAETKPPPTVAASASSRSTAPLPTLIEQRPKPAVTSVREDIRFVATSLQIEDKALWASSRSGGKRMVRFVDVAGLSARVLPTEPPFDGQLIVDLSPLAGRGVKVAPIRVTPKTQVNYELLPGGPGKNTEDSMRRLGALVRNKNRAVAVDAASGAFFSGGAATTLESRSDLAAYDSQFVPE